MKTKKPDIFLGITIGMLVLAVILCLVILLAQKSGDSPAETPSNTASTNDSGKNGDTGSPDGTGSTADSDDPSKTEPHTPPEELNEIDEVGLKAALDEQLSGLTSEWQVMVIDPAKGTRVTSTRNCGVDDWMKANRLPAVFIMGAAFQQVADGKLTEDQILADVQDMIVLGSTEAADRLTELIGGGDASKGRDTVKTFATDNGLQLGFNRALSGKSGKPNYASAQQTAMLLEKICLGELVSKAASDQMLEILCTPRQTDEIDPKLTGENISYGFVSDVEDGTCICTMGVVRLPNRSFVISIVCNKPVTTNGAKKKVGDLISVTQPFFAD